MNIRQQFITKPSKRRSGLLLQKPRFIVAHDTGNPGSTAANNADYYEKTRDYIEASAHLFVDDKEIVEVIPVLTGQPEKAWHVMYAPKYDNQMYGVDANDAAIGVEWCYGKAQEGKSWTRDIDGELSYRNFVDLLAFLCYQFNLLPATDITGHFQLDPDRKTDPVTGLMTIGKTFADLIEDTKEKLKHFS